MSAATARNSVWCARNAWLRPKAAAPSSTKTVMIPAENITEAAKARARTPGAIVPSAVTAETEAPAM